MNTLTSNPLFTRARRLAATFSLGLLALSTAAWAQSSAEAPRRSAPELQELVAPVALYPDDLVGALLPAASYPLQLVQAERVISSGGAPNADWDEAVVALMNYPEVVEFLNEDLDWTYSLGLAFVNQEPEVLAAIQSFRAEAMAAGNLRSDEFQVVGVDNGVITISPQNPTEIYVPYYEPQRVVVRQTVPVYFYHPVARPIYYYPYPASWAFNAGLFYGVGTYFNVGWNFGGLNVFYANQIGHPFLGRTLAPRHFNFRPRVRRARIVGVGPGRHHYRPGRHVSVRHPVRVRNQRRANTAYRAGIRDGRQVQRRRNAIVNNRPGNNRPGINGRRAGRPAANNNGAARRNAPAVNRSPQARNARNATRPGRVGQESAARRRNSAGNAAAPPAISNRNNGARNAARTPAARAANNGQRPAARAPQARRQPAARAAQARRQPAARAPQAARQASRPAARRQTAAPAARANRSMNRPARTNRGTSNRASRSINRGGNRGAAGGNRGGRGGGR